MVSVEPDETSQVILKQSFLRYRLRKKPLFLVAKAVSDKASFERLLIDAPGSAKNTLSNKWAETLRVDDRRFGQRLDFGHWKDVETTTIEQLIAVYGLPFFIKIDVEGHELSVLRGMKRAVPYLSFEVNLPEFRSEGLECIQTLGRLSENGTFNYTADCRCGLGLERWVDSQEFGSILSSCSENSIEVLWKTPVSEWGKTDN